MTTRHDAKIETLETGNIYFFYRPKVEQEEPQSLKDVQRLYMILSAEGQQRYRLAVLGRKKLPAPEKSGHRRFWGFIDAVSRKPEDIKKYLGPETYQTKTRGERHTPAGRAVGEGIYRILRHGDHTHLIYALELPENIDDVQESFNITEEASYIISVKNPATANTSPAGRPEEDQPDLPKKLQERFHGRKFIDADPPDFLNYEGTEFILISASDDIKGELGIEIDAQHEDEASADIFGDLKLARGKLPTQPLFKGQWV